MFEALHPIEFICVFFGANRIAVGHIEAGDTDVVDRGFEVAGLGIACRAGEAFAGVFDFVEAGDSDAVIGFLTEGVGCIACGGEVRCGEGCGFAFDFLHQKDVGFGFGEPFENVRKAGADGVYVPSGYAHAGYPCLT